MLLYKHMTDCCLACAEKKEDCCSSDYAKFTTLEDAKRAAKFLKTKAKNVVVYSELTKNDKGTELYTKKIHPYYYDLAPGKGKVLQLKKQKNGACFFLSEKGSCKIYSARPLICRAFPFWHSAKGRIIVDNNGLECGIVNGKTFENQELKPEFEKTVFAGLSTSKEGLKKLLLQIKKETADYKKNLLAFVKAEKIRA